MKIQLSSHITGNLLHLNVTYTNESGADETVRLREPKSLVAPGHIFIRDLSERMPLKPIEFTLIEQMEPGIAVTLVANGGAHSIPIKCSLEALRLKILDDTYLLQPTKKYEIFVRHGGISSNAIIIALTDFASN